jgi:amino acid adenylation domain-containing protein
MDDRDARLAGLSPARQALLALRRARQGRDGSGRGPREGLGSEAGGQAAPDGTTQAPASFAQERFWFLHRMDPLSPAYNIGRAYRLRGPVDRSALEQSVAEVVRRHEILRTTFAPLPDGQPVQVIAPSLDVPVVVTDVPSIPAPERPDVARRLAGEALAQPFDLERGPLLRVEILRFGPDDHVLVLSLHHIVSDAWSIGLLLREVATVYEAVRAGTSWQLPALPVQYRHFAAWQRERLASGSLDADLAYWREKLGRPLPESLLPADRPRPLLRTHHGWQERLTLSPALTQSLAELGAAEGASLFMILLAAMQVLVARYTGEEDVAIGCPVAARDRLELEPVIGCLLNTLVLRSDLSGAPSFRTFLRRARTVALEAYDHQEVPIEQLLAEIRSVRHGGRTPLFQVMLNMHEMTADLSLAGLEVERLLLDREVALFDMTLYFRRSEEGLILRLAFNADLFDVDRGRAMLEQLAHFLDQVVREPDRRIGELSLVAEGQAHALPDPCAPLNGDWKGAVHEGFEAQAQHAPERLAVVDDEGAWTYGELAAQSNRLAHYLLASGVSPDGVVAIYAHRNAPLAVAVLGVLKAGAAFTILDPAYPEQRLLDIVGQARPHGWVHVHGAPEPPAELARYAASLRCRCQLGPGRASVTGDGQGLDQYPSKTPDVRVGPESLACVTFTSGSAGRPKGVLGLHGSLSHFLPWQTEAFGFRADDRFSMLAGLAHDPLQRDIFTPLWVGASIWIPDPKDIFSPGWLSSWMARSGTTVAQLTPAMLQLLVETAPAESADSLPALRMAFTVGEALMRRDVEALRRLAPGVTHVNYYGATETQRALGYFMMPPGQAPGREVVPLGRGMPGAQLLVLNPAGRLAGVGELGEIHVRSAHLARGYLDDEALTRERFVVNPFTGRTGDRLYRTGDLGRYLPSGDVEFAGRADRQVKVRGFRIELGDIETALAAHPSVREAVVVTQEGFAGGTSLVAYVVASAPVVATELRRFVGQRLPAYMVPAHVVTLDAMPLTPNGKIDRAGLPAPSSSWLDSGDEFVAPRDEMESELAEVWRHTLGLDTIGVTQSFFDLGGHSLLALRLLAAVEGRFGRRLSLATLFEAPTVEQQAKLLHRDGWPGPRRSLVPIQPLGTNPPLYCVPGHAGTVLCFDELARRLAPKQPLYGLEPRGLEDGMLPHASIEDMATDYVREIRDVQPKGPYFLGGFCFGGLVAFEMAQQLREAGETVALLALFDALGQQPTSDVEAPPLRRAVSHLTRRVVVEYSNLRPLRMWERWSYSVAQGRQLARWIGRVARRRLGLPTVQRHASVSTLAQAQSVAARAYRRRPYHGPAVLFMAQRLHTQHYVDPRFGWGHVVRRLEVCLVPVPEGSVIQHPDAVSTVAAELLGRIRSAATMSY